MELYDMHSHILPDFDDGAKNVEVALELIEHLKKQGVRNICLTPHFYTNEMSLEDYLRERQEKFEAFLPYIPEDVNIVLGCEVYVTDYLFNNSVLNGLTYGNSRYIMTEFSYKSTFQESTMQKLYMLLQNHGLIPIIPHVERYPNLIDHPDKIADLKDAGVLIQTNISNYTQSSPFFKKRKLLKLIDKGLIDIIGSDTHSMKHNPPDCFREALTTIAEKCSPRAVKHMMATAEKIFNSAV